MHKKLLNWDDKGVRIDGTNLTNLRYADDTVLISDNLKDIRIIVEELQEAYSTVGLQINLSKTK